MGTGGSGNGCFIIRTQAAGAQVESFGFAFDHDRGWMNIGHPAPLGMALGMADIISVERSLTADIALQF